MKRWLKGWRSAFLVALGLLWLFGQCGCSKAELKGWFAAGLVCSLALAGFGVSEGIRHGIRVHREETTPDGSAPSAKFFSTRESLILRLLARGDELLGLQLVEGSAGMLGRGMLYPTLERLEEKGFLVSRPEEQAPGAVILPRRLYKLTPSGKKALDGWDASRLAKSKGLGSLKVTEDNPASQAARNEP